MKKILIVDDKLSLVKMLQDFLEAKGYQTVAADNGRNALYTARHEKPDLILLDLMMPEMNGYEFMELFRKEANTPIIMLTAKRESEVTIQGLELGADDYVTKPFDTKVLLARIQAVLRRYGSEIEVEILRCGSIEMNIATRQVSVLSKLINLTKKEFDILELLMRYAGKVFSRSELLGQDSPEGSERTIDVHIRRLREKLSIVPDTPGYIETVFGSGYRLNRRTQEV